MSSPCCVLTMYCVSGTNGGVSVMGLLSSLVGGCMVGLGYYMAILASLGPAVLESAPPQWPIIVIAALAGFLGSLIDSLLGATVQYSGKITSEVNELKAV